LSANNHPARPREPKRSSDGGHLRNTRRRVSPSARRLHITLSLNTCPSNRQWLRLHTDLVDDIAHT